jgi:antitoxin component of MazEF toxin-antitoxin module
MIPASVMRDYGWEVGDIVELQPMANGVAAIETTKRKSIAKIAQRLVRENIDLVRRLAAL